MGETIWSLGSRRPWAAPLYLPGAAGQQEKQTGRPPRGGPVGWPDFRHGGGIARRSLGVKAVVPQIWSGNRRNAQHSSRLGWRQAAQTLDPVHSTPGPGLEVSADRGTLQVCADVSPKPTPGSRLTRSCPFAGRLGTCGRGRISRPRRSIRIDRGAQTTCGKKVSAQARQSNQRFSLQEPDCRDRGPAKSSQRWDGYSKRKRSRSREGLRCRSSPCAARKLERVARGAQAIKTVSVRRQVDLCEKVRQH